MSSTAGSIVEGGALMCTHTAFVVTDIHMPQDLIEGTVIWYCNRCDWLKCEACYEVAMPS